MQQQTNSNKSPRKKTKKVASKKSAKANPVEVKKSETVLGFTTAQRRTMNLKSQIPGWGADLAPENRPGVPMDRAPFAGVETLYPDIEPQASSVEILKSTEHKKMPPVFGTTCPPKGVSGMLRRFAFKSSEGQLNHWLTLLLADRVDMVESVLTDLASGHIPNLYKEMGLAAEWKYNRTKFLRKIAFTGLGVAAAVGVATALVGSAKRNVTRT